MTNKGLVKGTGSGHLKLDNKRLRGLADPLIETDGVNKDFLDQTSSRRPSYSYADPANGIANPYSSDRGVYNYKSSNTRNLDQGISNAMAAGAATQGVGTGGITEWLWIGDSGSAGANSTVGTNQFDRLRAVPIACRDTLGTMGVPSAGSGFIRFTDNTFTDARVVTTGTWTNTLANLFSNTVSSTITTTIDRAATQLDIWYFQQAAAGTFTVSINGATSGVGFATVSAVGTAKQVRFRMPNVSIEKGSTVKITITVAGSGTYLSGVVPFVPNGGLLVHNVAQSSSQSGGSGTAAKNWNDFSSAGLGSVYAQLGLLFRQVSDASFTSGANTITSATAAFTNDDVGKPVDVLTAAAGKAILGQAYIVSITSGTVAVMNQNAIQTMSSQTANIGRPPSVLHIELGLNDLWNGGTVASVIANLKTIRNTFPSSANGTDCVLHLYGEMSYAYVTPEVQHDFWKEMYKLADALDCVLYDWRDRMGTYLQGQTINSYGDFFAHPTSATASDIGASLAVIVGGGNGLPSHSQPPVRGEDLTNKRYVDGKIRSGGLLTQSVTSNTETILAQVFIPANTANVGTQIDYDLITKPSIASVTNARLRVGQVGTVAGDTAFAVAGTGISSTNTQRLDGVMNVLSTGSSGTINGAGTFFGGTATNMPVGAPATVAIDTTKDNYISLTAFSATSALTNYAAKLEINL